MEIACICDLTLEIDSRALVSIVKTEKKTLPKTMVEQVLSRNNIVTLMLFNQRPIRNEDHHKSDSRPIGTPDSKCDEPNFQGHTDGHNSKSDGTLMGTQFQV